MFDIGFPELILIAIVGLLVIGPERLPEALRTLGLWLGRMRRSFVSVKAEIEKEIGMDEVKRQLHNEAIMEEMKRIEQEVKNTADSVQASVDEGMKAADIPSIDPNTQSDIADAVAAQDSVTPVADDDSSADDRSHADAAEDDRSHTDAAESADDSSTVDMFEADQTTSSDAEVPADAADDQSDAGDDDAAHPLNETGTDEKVKSG